MSPEVTQTHIPDRYSLERRYACSLRTDERPLLRDEHGRVLAVVEQWRPTDDPN